MIQLKFVDDTGTVEYNQDLHAIQVVFDSLGDFDRHMRIVKAAENMSEVYQTRSFLVVKEKFGSVSPIEFKVFFSTWLSLLNAKPDAEGCASPFYVSLIISRVGFLPFTELFFEKKLMAYKSVFFKIATSSHNACEFLKTKAKVKRARDYNKILGHG